MAMEFEQLFAKQLIQGMTKGLFKRGSSRGMMSSGNEMYRSHIVDTLSTALAKQEKLGMSDMISKYWNRETEAPSINSESKTESTGDSNGTKRD
jgi:Rod binding domain-containing protein